MKLFFLPLLCLLICFSAMGGTAHLQGKIANRTSDTISVTYPDNRISYTPKTFIGVLNKNGTFSMDVEIPYNFTECRLVYGDDYTELILSANDQLTLAADGIHFLNSLHYTGKDSAQANFVLQHMRDKESIFTTRKKTAALSQVPVSQVDSAAMADNQQELQYLNQYGKNLSPAFKQFWGMTYQYAAYTFLLGYPFTRFSYLKKQNPQVALKRDDTNLDYVPNAFNDSLIDYFAYQQYLFKYVSMKMMLGNNQPDSITQIIYQLMPPKSAAYAAALYIYHTLARKNVADTGTLLSNYQARFPASPYFRTIMSYNQSLKLLAPGMPALDFPFTTLEGKQMHLSELKGKVVVMNFWASWCAPCIGHLPEAKKVEDHFAGRPVVFLYISLDNHEAAWKAAIEKYHIVALHTLSEPGAIDEQYNVVGIPTSFLIDRKGNIVKEPEGSPALTEKIGELLLP